MLQTLLHVADIATNIRPLSLLRGGVLFQKSAWELLFFSIREIILVGREAFQVGDRVHLTRVFGLDLPREHILLALLLHWLRRLLFCDWAYHREQVIVSCESLSLRSVFKAALLKCLYLRTVVEFLKSWGLIVHDWDYSLLPILSGIETWMVKPLYGDRAFLHGRNSVYEFYVWLNDSLAEIHAFHPRVTKSSVVKVVISKQVKGSTVWRWKIQRKRF